MARPLRIDDPGMWHHVMNRGLGRMALFKQDDDRDLFLELLHDCASRWQVWTYAAV